jgi:Luciferase-like monooxygenase
LLSVELGVCLVKEAAAMDIGIWTEIVHYGVRPGELAEAAEVHGFESLLFANHTHIPATPATAEVFARVWGEGVIPPNAHVFDLFVAMTAAAAATTTLRIGSRVCPGAGAGPNRDGETGRQRRRAVRRSGPVRCRGGLDPGEDPEPSGDPSQRWAVQRDGYGHLYPPSSSTYAWHASQPPYRSAEQSPLRVVAVWGWRQVADVRVR